MAKERKGKQAKPRKAKAPPPAAQPAPAPSGDGALTGFPVVGIGASAGGLNAFKKFFAAMPPDSGIAFVLIPHLDPTHESFMAGLVGRQTQMPVVEAEDGMEVEANHVY